MRNKSVMWAGLSCVLVIASCVIPLAAPVMQVELRLPLPREVHHPADGSVRPDGWRVSWVTADGIRGDLDVSAHLEICTIALPKTGNAAILCRAVYGGHETLPYGALWPADTVDGVLLPDAEGGYAATLEWLCLLNGYDPVSYNAERLAREAVARLADPWDVAPASYLDAVVAGRFSVGFMRQPARIDTATPVVDGIMVPDSPWGQVLTPGGGVVVSMAPGRVYRWFGEAQVLSGAVDTSGVAVWVRSSFQSGTRMQNELPWPGRLDTAASPPWASAMCFTMASPRPVPPRSLLRALSTR